MGLIKEETTPRPLLSRGGGVWQCGKGAAAAPKMGRSWRNAILFRPYGKRSHQVQSHGHVVHLRWSILRSRASFLYSFRYFCPLTHINSILLPSQNATPCRVSEYQSTLWALTPQLSPVKSRSHHRDSESNK